MALQSFDAYAQWRYRTLNAQFHEHFGAESAKDKDALDFGCGDGALCFVLTDVGAKSVHGIDQDERQLQRCAQRLQHFSGTRRPSFSRSPNPSIIDLPSASFDAIYCLDVLEHVMDYVSIIREWHRILRPGGTVYIWWQPYWHPYGHHSYDLVPIPWAHVFLTDEEMNEVCARTVDWNGFDAPIWDRNADGTKKNRYRGAIVDDYLNKLTVSGFEKNCCDAGFELRRREFHPFNGNVAKKISSALIKVPHVRDYFMACAVYELAKRPTEGSGTRTIAAHPDSRAGTAADSRVCLEASERGAASSRHKWEPPGGRRP